jgi:bacterioferritin-associated ferredoxin
MTRRERVDEFIRGLEELRQRTGLAINSCGECESMWVIEVNRNSPESQKLLAERVEFYERESRYVVGNYLE